MHGWLSPFTPPFIYFADVSKLVHEEVSNTSAARLVGSSPTVGIQYAGIAQLAEYCAYIAGVTGSSPVISSRRSYKQSLNSLGIRG